MPTRPTDRLSTSASTTRSLSSRTPSSRSRSYARFVKGLTKDERFAAMGFAVQLLGSEAKRVTEGGGI